MPRKVTSQASGDVQIKFQFQPAQRKLFQWVRRGGGIYLQLIAPQCLEIGGIRSGKTVGKMMYYIMNHCLRFSHCDILILRRTFSELDSGVIQDFKTFIPEELYHWNGTTRTATFHNGSRAVFGGCVNNKDKDIEKYLGQSYSGILVDECGQFSPYAWQILYSRNLVNAACEHDEHGNLPIPSITGCTNPIGPYWEFYHEQFILKQPWEKEEGIRRARDGSYWVVQHGSDMRKVYDPKHYAANHTTLYDNQIYTDRDPGIIIRLKSLPKAKMQKMLLGYMDRVEGQYFDCFNEDANVVDLREDPEAVIWEDWQPVWAGQDFGVGHWNAIYLFTKAQVRTAIDAEYKLKTVCFKEFAPEVTGHTNVELANMLDTMAFYPKLLELHPQHARISGKRCKVSAIYFSHEKFSRVMEAHSPADDYSQMLRQRGLPSVTRASTDRIGRASFMYNMLKRGNLVILASCRGIVQAIPALQRDPDNLDDVLKVDSKADDRYDAFAYGLFGQMGTRKVPLAEKEREFADSIVDPIAKHFFLQRQKFNHYKEGQAFKQKEQPTWASKV